MYRRQVFCRRHSVGKKLRFVLKRRNKIVSVCFPAFGDYLNIPPERIEQIFRRFPEGTSDYIPMQFGYKCGMRLGEAFAVCWEDIDFEKHTVYINKQIQWDNKEKYWYFSNPKYNSFRTVELDSELYDTLVRAHDRQERARAFYDNYYCNLYLNAKNVINTEGDGVIIHPIAVRENGTLISPRTMQHTSKIIHHEFGYPDFTFHSDILTLRCSQKQEHLSNTRKNGSVTKM